MDRYYQKDNILHRLDYDNYASPDFVEKLSINYDNRFEPIVITQPYRELQTKSLADDFYSNLIDWYKDKIYFAIEDTVFCHNFYTSKTNHVKSYSSTTITSIKGVDSGIIIGTSSGNLHVSDVNTMKSSKFPYHKSRIGVIKSEGTNIITGSRDKRIKIIDIRSSKISNTILQHTQEVCGLGINKNKKFLVSGGNDNKLFIFDYRQLTHPLKKCTQHKAAIKAISWSPNNPNLFISGGGTADKTVKLWDTNLINNSSDSPLTKSIDYGSQVCSIQWLKNNQVLNTHGYSKDDIRLCSLFNFKFQKQYLGHRNRVIHFSVSPDEKYFVTGSADCSMKFWEVSHDTQVELKIR